MTPKERMECVWEGRQPDRVPFVPAVYEQKAYLIKSTPSKVSRDAELLYRAMMVEYETYQADALVIGMDVYNLEAEALGSKVTYYEGDDTSIPGIGAGNHGLHFGADLSGLKILNPLKDGRMPINLEVARRIAPLTRTVPVRGALSGPFSLALSLLGPEAFFIGTIDDPDYCKRVLSFCADTIIAFGRAYLDAGVSTIMFDSQASPDLLSPDMYVEMVLPHTQRVMKDLFAYGEKYCPLVIGGNTTLMLDAYIQSGTRQILCDFSADWPIFRQRCQETGMAVRRNMNPIRVQKGKPEELAAAAKAYLADAKGMNGFILGTAVVPFGTPTENLKAIRQVCLDARQPTVGVV